MAKTTILRITTTAEFKIEAEDVAMHQNSFPDRVVFHSRLENESSLQIYFALAQSESALKEIEHEFYSELVCEILKFTEE